MGTYAKFCAEVRQNGQWHLNEKEVFPFPKDAWQREKGDGREFWEYPFPSQSYSLFGFLAGIRNYSETAVLSEPRGLPEDTSDDAVDLLAPHSTIGHAFDLYGTSDEEAKPMTVADRVHEGSGDNYGYSWLSLAELIGFDYDQTFTDQREEPPEVTTYRVFLGEGYFAHIEALKRLGSPDDVRILFCFNG